MLVLSNRLLIQEPRQTGFYFIYFFNFKMREKAVIVLLSMNSVALCDFLYFILDDKNSHCGLHSAAHLYSLDVVGLHQIMWDFFVQSRQTAVCSISGCQRQTQC